MAVESVWRDSGWGSRAKTGSVPLRAAGKPTQPGGLWPIPTQLCLGRSSLMRSQRGVWRREQRAQRRIKERMELIALASA